MADLTDLKAKVARLTTVSGSVIALLIDIRKRLDEAIADDDPAALKALADDLGRDTDALAAAVAANTPGAPPPDADV